MKKIKSNVTLKGNKSDGYIITIFGRDGFVGDIAITFEELIELKNKLNSKL